MFSGFAERKQGAGHKDKGKPCQDAANYTPGGEYAVAVVSDGHGGEKYFRSGTGAKKAVEVAQVALLAFLKEYRGKLGEADATERRALLRHLTGHIIAAWQDEIQKSFALTPLDVAERELCERLGLETDFQASFYGATLLFTAMTPDYSFAAQIGDGETLALHEGMVSRPIPEDERLGFGTTTSLCDSDAINNFRYFFAPNEGVAERWGRAGSEELPGFFAGRMDGLFLMTDGVADSYTPEGLDAFSLKLLAAMREDAGEARQGLKNWLPKLSEQGSRDDVSIAGIFRGKA